MSQNLKIDVRGLENQPFMNYKYFVTLRSKVIDSKHKNDE